MLKLDLLNYLKENNAQKQIDKLAKKLKGKKIAIYGAGEYFELIVKTYDLSSLNIVAIADLKFETNKDCNNTPYKPIAPNELKNYGIDVIVMALINDINVLKIIDKKVLKGSKNENIRVMPLISPTLKYIIKLYFK